MRLRLAIVAVGAALLAPPAALADHGGANLPWPAALPPMPTDSKVQPGPVPGCREAKLRCVERAVDRMTQRWRPLDRSCDHRAVFSLTYLRTTEGFLRTLRRDPDFFRYRRWVIYEDALFADYYFRAYDRYEKERKVPAAWRIAFDAATGAGPGPSQTSGVQDLFLGMNAHIQRDLPYVLAEVGLRSKSGRSRKADHDRVNEILASVLDPIQNELARRYDPLFTLSDLKPLPADELGAFELLKGWREGAWRNAERLVNADTREQRREAKRSIETTARLWAEAIRAATVPGYPAIRDAHCEARHAP